MHAVIPGGLRTAALDTHVCEVLGQGLRYYDTCTVFFILAYSMCSYTLHCAQIYIARSVLEWSHAHVLRGCGYRAASSGALRFGHPPPALPPACQMLPAACSAVCDCTPVCWKLQWPNDSQATRVAAIKRTS